ncbi:MAG: MFS transporter [Nocardioides sp.]|uniref:MFS transporter n=1 Tax=Nocardioides sp. TaxID=35761 RepID=UPI0039E71D21
MSTETSPVIKARGTFAALGSPAYRRYFIGQAFSLPGTWMQTIAQGWLVLELTDSGTVLGLVTAAQFVPVLLLAPYAGLMADRHPKRLLLILTQSTMAAVALVLAVLTLSGHVGVAAIVIGAVVLGIATAQDNPTRQAFVSELVDRELVRNAITLNSIAINCARAVGPAIAGILVAAVGAGWCFAANAVSFVAVIAALVTLPLPTAAVIAAPRASGQLRAGLAHVLGRRELLLPLSAIALVGTLAWEFPVTLPMLARGGLHGDSRTYGWLTTAMGVGAVAGGLAVARHSGVGLRRMAVAGLGFGTAIGVLALSPNVIVAVGVAVLVGAGGTIFMSVANATIQLASADEFRGRVMSLWSISFAGSTPIGGPLLGIVAEHVSARAALGVGAVGCALAAGVGLAGASGIIGTRAAPVAPEPSAGRGAVDR